MFKKKIEENMNKTGFPCGLQYASLAVLSEDDLIALENFHLRCTHKEYLLGYVIDNVSEGKHFEVVMDDERKILPYFDNVLEAELGLELSDNKEFVINANPITSFGIKEPCTENSIISELSKHSMNFKFLDKDKIQEKGKKKKLTNGVLFEGK